MRGGCLSLAVAVWFLAPSFCRGGDVAFRRHVLNAESEFVAAAVFDVNQSFQILFMIIVGGLGSLTGSFFGAALIFILPIAIRAIAPAIGLPLQAATVENLQYIIVGTMIIFFLIVEPHGIARLWQIGKQKLRVWPFPY